MKIEDSEDRHWQSEAEERVHQQQWHVVVLHPRYKGGEKKQHCHV